MTDQIRFEATDQDVRAVALAAAAGQYDVHLEGIVTNADQIAATLERAEAYAAYIATGRHPDADIVEADPENEDATRQVFLDVLDDVEKQAHKALDLGVINPDEVRGALETVQIIRMRLGADDEELRIEGGDL
jgi:hypothetical protein